MLMTRFQYLELTEPGLFCGDSVKRHKRERELYPKNTGAVIEELTRRGFGLDYDSVAYLIRKHDLEVARFGAGRNLSWQIKDIEELAGILARERSYSPAGGAALHEGYSLFQAERELAIKVMQCRQPAEELWKVLSPPAKTGLGLRTVTYLTPAEAKRAGLVKG